ncbi:ABC transporter ATP-binding protein [Streptomyces sp. MUM 203J]|uniref:ABC transporter ATP-binding protein n=1 Tax=Streptomyces sp. MUM 203J TaxID=2791990 RepID=UPI0035ABFF62|nr:ABC transporter ATP-binding protein [Streptomyces sp. MUM 203J]
MSATGDAGTTAPDRPMVAARGLVRTYGGGPAAVHALRGVDLTLPRGELVAVHGPSGVGKTTLLNLVGGLDRPDEGRVVVDGTDLSALREKRLLELRRERIGFVFQTFGLVPVLSAAENVGVPLRLRRVPWREREERVARLLDRIGLGDHAAQRPGELSGGQQQRVAVARALAAGPALLIADEPTSQLDAETRATVVGLLRAAVDDEGTTALVTTHDEELLDRADRVYALRDGVLARP